MLDTYDAIWRFNPISPRATVKYIQEALKHIKPVIPASVKRIETMDLLRSTVADAARKSQHILQEPVPHPDIQVAFLRLIFDLVSKHRSTPSRIAQCIPGPGRRDMPWASRVALPAEDSDLIILLHELIAADFPSANGMFPPGTVPLPVTPDITIATAVAICANGWAVLWPRRLPHRQAPQWNFISQHLGRILLTSDSEHPSLRAFWRWLASPPPDVQCMILGSITPNQKDRSGNSLPQLYPEMTECRTPSPPPVMDHPPVIQPAADLELSQLIYTHKGIADATNNCCLISTITQLLGTTPRQVHAFTPKHTATCIAIRHQGAAQGIPQFAQVQIQEDLVWPPLDFNPATVTYIVNACQVNHPILLMGWSVHVDANGITHTNLGHVQHVFPPGQNIIDVEATETVHLWAPQFDTHFEPLWWPFGDHPRVRAELENVGFNLAAIPAADVPHAPVNPNGIAAAKETLKPSSPEPSPPNEDTNPPMAQSPNINSDTEI
jgi:hypothetical protein